MATKIIKINRIYDDRQRCMDESGRVYSILDIRNLISSTGVDINVHIVRNRNGSKHPYSIRYKRNCKIQNIKIKKVSEGTIKSEVETYDYGEKYLEAYLVIEDRGSAKEIIKNIVKKFAEHSKIKLSIHYIFAGGVGLIPKVLSKYIPDNARVLIIYDSALQDAKTLSNIVNNIKFLKIKENIEFISFTPRCIEECALSFNKLKTEIKGLNAEQIELLDAIDSYTKTGTDYISYDPYTCQYNINRKPIILGYESRLISKYKTVDTLEKYLADKLAEMTDRKPYEFIKRASICWYKNCKSSSSRCVYEDTIGTKRPNTPVNYCRMGLICKDKTEEIIKGSLFGILYDAIELLLFGKSSVSNKSNLKSLLRRY